MKRIAIAIALTTLATMLPGGRAEAATTRAATPGEYGELRVGVDPASGALSGSFYAERGAGQFSCGYLLYGDGKPSADGSFAVTTWWPDRELYGPSGAGTDEITPGRLRFETGSDGRTLVAQLTVRRGAHGGCLNVIPPGDTQLLPLDHARPQWRQWRAVKAAKLTMFAMPSASAAAGAYVVAGDVVVADARRGTWVHVSFTPVRGEPQDPKTSTGWVRESGLLPVTPPAH